jgi:hypothetical protein
MPRTTENFVINLETLYWDWDRDPPSDSYGSTVHVWPVQVEPSRADERGSSSTDTPEMG